MNTTKIFSDAMQLADFAQWLIKAGDFHGAFIKPAYGKNFHMAEVLIERRGKNIFVVVNRKGFVGDGASFLTWIGDYTEFLPALQGHTWKTAWMAIAYFVKSSPLKKEQHLLRATLEEIHFKGAHLLLGENEYMVTAVRDPHKKPYRFAPEEKPDQLRLF